MKIISAVLLSSIFAMHSLGADIDVAFVFTPDGREDFLQNNVTEQDIMQAVSNRYNGAIDITSGIDIGEIVSFHFVGSQTLDEYTGPYYGDGIMDETEENFSDDTGRMLIDLGYSNQAWTHNIKDIRAELKADILVFIPGDADVEPDNGGVASGGFTDGDGQGFVLMPGRYSGTIGIVPHESLHVFGVSHEEMDSDEYTKIILRANTVANFAESIEVYSATYDNTWIYSNWKNDENASSYTKIINLLDNDSGVEKSVEINTTGNLASNGARYKHMHRNDVCDDAGFGDYLIESIEILPDGRKLKGSQKTVMQPLDCGMVREAKYEGSWITIEWNPVASVINYTKVIRAINIQTSQEMTFIIWTTGSLAWNDVLYKTVHKQELCDSFGSGIYRLTEGEIWPNGVSSQGDGYTINKTLLCL